MVAGLPSLMPAGSVIIVHLLFVKGMNERALVQYPPREESSCTVPS